MMQLQSTYALIRSCDCGAKLEVQEKRERVRMREGERQVCLSVEWTSLLLTVWLVAAGICVFDSK